MAGRSVARDTVIGAVVLVVAAILFGLIYSKDSSKARTASEAGYLLHARFNRADGITVGSDVRVSGVSVGKVVQQQLGADFRADITLRVHPEVTLTVDTLAAIQTDGLLGAKYVELKPGGDDTMLKPGQVVPYTQDSMVIEDLLDMIIQQGKAKRGHAGQQPRSDAE